MGMRRVVVVLALVALALMLGSCAAATDPATNVTPNGAILHAHGHTDSSAASATTSPTPPIAPTWGPRPSSRRRSSRCPPASTDPTERTCPFAARTVTLRPDTTY